MLFDLEKKQQNDLNITYGDIRIQQHIKVSYLGCILDNDLSRESMATKLLGLVNGRLKFLYREQSFYPTPYIEFFLMLRVSPTTITPVLLGTLRSVTDS